MRFLFLEPFYGGSHKDFADGLIRHSRYDIDLSSLPARFWKWRMRGAALHYYRKIKSFDLYDGLIVSDLMSLADLKALCNEKLPPTILYFHENQFAYPLAESEQMDYQFGFTNITSALAADIVAFNSETHYRSFFSHLARFVRMMPEFNPHWVSDEIKQKSRVIYPGCHFRVKDAAGDRKPGAPLVIIWNHRWEFDKRPENFFQALYYLQDLGIDFEVVLLGERYKKIPPAFTQAEKRLGRRIIHTGYVESRTEYYQWLSRGDVAISTADQENFGIAVVEAIRHGCLPLLPNRLSYPEILPAEWHSLFLYEDQNDLQQKLFAVANNLKQYTPYRQSLSESMGRFAWEQQVRKFDEVLHRMTLQ